MKIMLTEWAARNYSPPPSIRILRAWASSGQIVPPPEKVGRAWMVDEKAVRVPAPALDVDIPSGMSERALRILKSSL